MGCLASVLYTKAGSEDGRRNVRLEILLSSRHRTTWVASASRCIERGRLDRPGEALRKEGTR